MKTRHNLLSDIKKWYNEYARFWYFTADLFKIVYDVTTCFWIKDFYTTIYVHLFLRKLTVFFLSLLLFYLETQTPWKNFTFLVERTMICLKLMKSWHFNNIVENVLFILLLQITKTQTIAIQRARGSKSRGSYSGSMGRPSGSWGRPSGSWGSSYGGKGRHYGGRGKHYGGRGRHYGNRNHYLSESDEEDMYGKKRKKPGFFQKMKRKFNSFIEKFKCWG